MEFLWVLLGILYFVLMVTLGVMTFRGGHYWLFGLEPANPDGVVERLRRCLEGAIAGSRPSPPLACGREP